MGETNLHYLHTNRKKGRSCGMCHAAHGTEGKFLLRKAIPFGRKGWMLKIGHTPQEGGGSCAPGCHKAFPYKPATRRVPPEKPEDEPSPSRGEGVKAPEKPDAGKDGNKDGRKEEDEGDEDKGEENG